jgi:outer membrane protein OmpA-like peptidoglycan-associated protein
VVAIISMAGFGCATKKYVAQQVQPVQQRVDQLRTAQDQTNKNLQATDEVAKGADANASKALNEINATNGKVSDLNGKVASANSQIGQINAALGNIDDYKAGATTTVYFKTNSAKLSADATSILDSFVSSNLAGGRRYFVAIMGYTDHVGGVDYNLALSRRRAESVQTYLVGGHNIPPFRVQIVGFGKDNPADTGKGKDARAKNRRVELTLYTAPSPTGSSNPANAPSSDQP